MMHKKSRLVRVGLLIVLAFLVVTAGAGIIFHAFYKEYIIKHIDGWVYTGTDSVYHASLRDVHINLLTDKITVNDIRIWPDTASQHFKKKTRNPVKVAVGVSVAELELDDLQIIKLIAHKIVSFGNVYISQPRVWIESRPSPTDSTPRYRKPPAVKGLTAGNIYIFHPDILYKSINDNGNFTCKLAGGDAVLNDWRLDSTRKDTSRFLLAKSCTINGPAFSFDKPSMMYLFKVGAFDFNSERGHIALKNLEIEPPMSNDSFYNRLGHRTTICRLHIPVAGLAGFDWNGLMHRNTLKADLVTVDAMKLGLYFSYVVPSHPVNMLAIDPHMLLRNAGLKIDVKEIIIHKSAIKYTEKEETSKMEESVPFRNIEGQVTNVTNIKSIIKEHPHLEIKAHGTAFIKGDLTAMFKLALADSLGGFNLEAHLMNVDATDIRQQARVLALIQVDTLQIQKIHVNVSGNRDTARSVLEVVYHNFRMKVLRAKADKVLTPMPVVSFVARTFFVYSDNPMPGKDLRVTTTFTKRDPKWAYFGSIVKNVKLGARHALTDHPKVVDVIIKGNTDKNKTLKFIKRLFTKKKK